MKEAASQEAELVLFPETYVSAYPKELDFGARIGMRFPEGREDFRRYFESAVEIPSLAQIAWITIKSRHDTSEWVLGREFLVLEAPVFKSWVMNCVSPRIQENKIL